MEPTRRILYPFTAEYPLGTITGHWSLADEPEALLARLDAAESTPEALVVSLVALLVDWNITRSGEPVPINEETLGQVPVSLLYVIDRAITASARAEGLLPMLN